MTVAEQEGKKSGELELSPEEAIRAMLDGEILISRSGIKYKWDIGCGGSGQFTDVDGVNGLNFFCALRRQPQKKTRPMDTFECLAWVNSPDSLGWMVSWKTDNYTWGDWDIPQRFHYNDSIGSCEYRRARALPDKSGIDESTIQGFVVEVE